MAEEWTNTMADLTDEAYMRSQIPTDTTLNILVSAYTPRTISKDQLAPSPIAKRRQADKKRANDYRRMTAFQR